MMPSNDGSHPITDAWNDASHQIRVKSHHMMRAMNHPNDGSHRMMPSNDG